MSEPVCDFCKGNGVHWSFRCYPFVAVLADGTGYSDDGEWAACDACKGLVETRDDCKLLLRLTVLNGSATLAQAHLLMLFFANRMGQPRPVSAEELATW